MGSKDEGEPTITENLPFDVTANAQSHVAKEMLERMKRDAKVYLFPAPALFRY
jgi:hypothetical protein